MNEIDFIQLKNKVKELENKVKELENKISYISYIFWLFIGGLIGFLIVSLK